MANYTLYIDTSSNNLLAALNRTAVLDPSTIPLYFGDTIGIQVYLQVPTQNQDPQQAKFNTLTTTGRTLYLYLDDGTVGGTIYTQQVTWSTDPTNSYYFANLPLNTAAMQSQIGSGTSMQAWLKIGYVENGFPTTVYSRQVTINVGIPIVSLAVAPGLTPASVEASNATYFPRASQAGLQLELQSAAGKKIIIFVQDNPDGTGSLQFSAIN